MDISNLVHGNTSPADVIFSNTSTSASAQIPSSNSAFPGPLLTAHKKSPGLQPARKARTVLLIIDTQRGVNASNGHFGSERSTPQFEENISRLLAACRGYNASVAPQQRTAAPATDSTVAEGGGDATDYPVQIMHVYHQSRSPRSPLHPSGAVERDGMRFMACAEPDTSSAHESVFSKTTSSAFVDGKLKEALLRHGVEQLIVGGLVTDHCVNSSVRWARDLDVVKGPPTRREDGGSGPGKGKIVMLRDATACFAKGGFDAETVQRVSLASLEGEFAEVAGIDDVLRELFG